MNIVAVELSDFPIVARPIADPEERQVTLLSRAICLAARTTLELPATVSLDTNEGYATLSYCGKSGAENVTEVRLRINGFANGQGSKKDREYLSISFVALHDQEVVGWSEDVKSTPRKCGLLTFIGTDGKETPITDALRARVAAKATAAAPKGKKRQKEQPAKRVVTSILVADAPIRSVDLSPNGRFLATTHEDQHVVLWDAETGKSCWSNLAGGSGMNFVRASAFSPDSRFVASGSSTLRMFAVDTGKPVDAPPGHPKGELVDVAWSKECLATASAKTVQKADNSVALWDVARSTLLKQWKMERPCHIEFLSGAHAIAVLSTFNKLSRIDIATGAIVTHDLDCFSFAATTEGLWASTDKGFQLLDLKTFEVRRTLASAASYHFLGASANGSVLVAGLAVGGGSDDETRLQRIDPTNGRVISEWALPARIPGMQDHMAAIRARAEGEHVDKYDDDAPPLRALMISPKGDRVIAATAMALAIWTPDGTPLLSPSIAIA